jgi:Flp pilus assembly protein TadG
MRFVRLSRVRDNRAHARAGVTARQRGQALVEFSLVIPIFLLVLISIVEFALVFNALLSINFASREAALMAAEAGNTLGADCLILNTVESKVTPPARPSQISQVRIYKATSSGAIVSGKVNTYTRSGSMSCSFADGTTLSVPYSLVGSPGYPDSNRCNVLVGCGAGSTTVDQVGVEITYGYTWQTPMGSLLNAATSGYTMVKANAMRMEPVL